MSRRSSVFWLRLTLACCFSSCIGCQPSQQAGPRTDIPIAVSQLQEDCQPLPGEPVAGGTIIFALADSVNPGHAPVPHNVSERIVFRNLYETLVEVTCDGRLIPGLAARWEGLQDDRVWIMTIRDDVRFWDGTLLTAVDVKTAWIRAQACPVTELGQTPLIWINARAESVKVLDRHHLAVTLPEPQADFPVLLAHAAFAVAVRRPGWSWPVGTGPFRLEPDAGPLAPDLNCLPFDDHRAPPVLESLLFRCLAGADPRDVLGDQCDVLLVRDRSPLTYFQRVPGVTAVALPWDRLYLLLCPLKGSERDRERWYTGWHRGDLARDVVTATAQPHEEPFFLPPAERLCPQMTGPVEMIDWPPFSWNEIEASLDQDLILHPSDDEDARRLAERLAVLAGRPLRPGPDRPGRGPLTPPRRPAGAAAPQAVAVPDEDFPGAVQSERAGAYILPLERSFASACFQFSSVLSMAYWLQDAGRDDDVPGNLYPRSARAEQPVDDFHLAEITEAAHRLAVRGIVVPLVVTRSHLVTAGPLTGLELAYDGTPLFGRAGWRGRGGELP